MKDRELAIAALRRASRIEVCCVITVRDDRNRFFDKVRKRRSEPARGLLSVQYNTRGGLHSSGHPMAVVGPVEPTRQ